MALPDKQKNRRLIRQRDEILLNELAREEEELRLEEEEKFRRQDEEKYGFYDDYEHRWEDFDPLDNDDIRERVQNEVYDEGLPDYDPLEYLIDYDDDYLDPNPLPEYDPVDFF